MCLILEIWRYVSVALTHGIILALPYLTALSATSSLCVCVSSRKSWLHSVGRKLIMVLTSTAWRLWNRYKQQCRIDSHPIKVILCQAIVTQWWHVVTMVLGQYCFSEWLDAYRCQAITSTNVDLSWTTRWQSGTHSNEMLIIFQTLSFTKSHLKTLSAKYQPSIF